MANTGNFFLGTPGQIKTTPTVTPQASNALQQLLSQGMQNTNFQGIEDLARKNFQQKTIPSLAERFTALSGDTRGSSAFQGALGQAGSDLESQLAALRGQYGLQQLSLGLTPQFENMYQQGQGGAGAPLAQGIGSGIGYAAPSYLASLFGGGSGTAGAGSALGGVGGSAATGTGTALASGAGTAAASGVLPLAAILGLLAGGYGLYNYLDSQG